MIRNFYIKADIDGRKESLKDGPRKKDGGFSLSVYQRKDGQAERVVKIKGFVDNDDTLTTYVTSQTTEQIIKTRR